MKRASYREAVEWIALNDDAVEHDVDNIRASISVLLIADLFRVESARVATDVLRFRLKDEANAGRMA